MSGYDHWRLLDDRILIRHVQLARKSRLVVGEDGGPFAAKALFEPHAKMLARVINVGPGRRSRSGVLVPVRSQVGDVILIEKEIAYRPLWSDDKPGGKYGVYMVRDRDVLAVFNPGLEDRLLESEADDESK